MKTMLIETYRKPIKEVFYRAVFQFATFSLQEGLETKHSLSDSFSQYFTFDFCNGGNSVVVDVEIPQKAL